MDTKQVVTHYHNAWTSGDMNAARASLANDLDFQGSIETFRRKRGRPKKHDTNWYGVPGISERTGS